MPRPTPAPRSHISPPSFFFFLCLGVCVLRRSRSSGSLSRGERMRGCQSYLRHLCAGLGVALLAVAAVGQQKPPDPSPLRLTLADALDRARQNSVVYQAALTDARIAHEDKKQSVAALLPSVNYNNSAIYTQGTGVDNQVRFIANNAVHEYISQGNAHEALDVAGVAEARRTAAIAAVAKARAEIASRGLVVTVVQS